LLVAPASGAIADERTKSHRASPDPMNRFPKLAGFVHGNCERTNPARRESSLGGHTRNGGDCMRPRLTLGKTVITEADRLAKTVRMPEDY
jgi:hypothetical protein